METIRNYLDNLFRNLPRTEEIERLKNELSLNMEEKYHELKAEGKLENEAVGIVISEFGNIDELLEEMNIKLSDDRDFHPVISIDEAQQFMNLKKKASYFVGIGVVLVIIGVSMLIFLYQALDDNYILQMLSEDIQDFIPVTILILLVAAAVGLFIYSGTLLEDYKFIEKGLFELSTTAKAALENYLHDISPKQTRNIIIGVFLCIIAPISIFIGSIIGDSGAVYGVSILLILVAIAAFLFIYSGSIPEACKMLLKKGDFEPVQKKQNKLIGAIAGIVFPIATCIFLYEGFVYNRWYIAWIVFPITGILLGGFSAFYTAIKAKDNI